MKIKKRKMPAKAFKRTIDLGVCLLSLPIIVPLGLILSLYICMDSGGSPFYCQERIGQHGKTFKVWKFRTMVKNAEKELETWLNSNPAFAEEWEKSQKLKNDPRLTKAGIFLRKTSLDELPQIINILLGTMTLVGPRPIVKNEKKKYGRYFNEYCEVKPGLTGLWQISGRNNVSYKRRVAYDHYYINNWSIFLDFWILAKTIPAVFHGDGAY